MSIQKHDTSLEAFIDMSKCNAQAAETHEDALDWIQNTSYLLELQWFRENYGDCCTDAGGMTPPDRKPPSPPPAFEHTITPADRPPASPPMMTIKEFANRVLNKGKKKRPVDHCVAGRIGTLCFFPRFELKGSNVLYH